METLAPFFVHAASLYIVWVGLRADPRLVRNAWEGRALLALGMVGAFASLAVLMGLV